MPSVSTLAVAYFALVLCGAPVAAGKTVEFKCGMGRQCFLYLPEEIDPAKTYWLVVGVHGYRGNGKGAAGLTGWVKKADCIVVGPSFPDGYQLLGEDSDKQLLGIFTVLFKKYKLQRRMFIHGFSGGAQFAHRFTMKYPEAVIGCSAHSGGSWSSSVNPKARHIPFAVSCGEADTSRLEGAKRYFTMLGKGGFYFKARIWPGVGHGFTVDASRTLDDCFNLSTTGMYPGQKEVMETVFAEFGKLVEGGKHREALDRLAEAENLKLPASMKTKGAADKPDDQKILPGENRRGWREGKAGVVFLSKVRKAFISERIAKAMTVIEGAGLMEVLRIETDKPADAAEQLKELQIRFKGAVKASRAITDLRIELVRKASAKPTTRKASPRTRPRIWPGEAEKKAKSRLGLARSYIMAGQKEKGAKILRSILTDFPDTSVADEAREMLGKQ